MDGLINFNKPLGLSSAQALDRVRRITGQRKSGHAGTLDPLADGVLVLCMGRGTKLVERFMDQPKTYRATARLDVTSASFDSGRELLPVDAARIPSREELLAALAAQTGEIQQIPPAVSAIKVAGRRAYRMELSGAAPRLGPRSVTVRRCELLAYEWPVVAFEVQCGRGVYIRAMIRDVGLTLGTGGCLTGLTRTSVGPFAVEQAWTLERLESARAAEEYLIPLDTVHDLLARGRTAERAS